MRLSIIVCRILLAAPESGQLSPGDELQKAAAAAAVGGSKADGYLRELTALRHWLTDSEREVAAAVELTDGNAVKQARKAHQVGCSWTQSEVDRL